jgi:hypothetical protein
LTQQRHESVKVFIAGLVAMTSTLLGACATESPAEACTRGPIFSSARQRAENAVSELDRTNTIELEESVTAVVDQLLLLREVSPRELRDPLGVLLAAYGQLVVALDGVSWNPRTADTDAAVSKARAAFAETSVAESADDVVAFFAEQCEIALGETNPRFAITGTTLPLPQSGDEASLDAAESDVVDDAELAAIGFTVGETYGVALTADEALCVARSLANSPTAANPLIDDATYFALIEEFFAGCAIATPPTTTPSE